MDAVKLAPLGDPNAVRWVAVRHNADHIHLVATLVRQDGRRRGAEHDKPNARNGATSWRTGYGLRRVRPDGPHLSPAAQPR